MLASQAVGIEPRHSQKPHEGGWLSTTTRKQGRRRPTVGERPDSMSTLFTSYLVVHRQFRGDGKRWGLKEDKEENCESG